MAGPVTQFLAGLGKSMWDGVPRALISRRVCVQSLEVAADGVAAWPLAQRVVFRLSTSQTLSGEAEMKKEPVGTGNPEPEVCLGPAPRALSTAAPAGPSRSPAGSKAKHEKPHQ